MSVGCGPVMTVLQQMWETFMQQHWIKKIYDGWLVACVVIALFFYFSQITEQTLLLVLLPMIAVGYFVRIVVYLKG